MKKTLIAVVASSAAALWAADKIQPLHAKLGLWEVTVTQQIKGAPTAPAMPSMPSIPEDKLAQLPPQQRAQIEAMMKQRAGSGGTTGARTRQTCITPDRLDKAPFSEDRKSCQRTIVNSTASAVDIHEECSKDGGKQIVDAHYELNGDDKMKGTVKMKGAVAGHDMEMNMDIQGKWLGSDCGSVK